MKMVIKNIVSLGMSLILISSIMHIEHHSDENIDGYSICKSGCEEEAHHSVDNHCQKCLNKNQRLNNLKNIYFSVHLKINKTCDINQVFDFESIIFDFHSLPPPVYI